ncbi:MobC family plasmid mobilization relaxosome protein [Nocardia otitidiscaviarum]|uniref:plasmid mobilization relaxosome protein MobC n=1 Tax=Nocardia otitidiscaviarum TaxID=1823 RepID=UPI0020CFBD7C|nr:plasmid mobilization relaxosome protein MobC [Nocardia otitidiscaviarum]MCP9625234.1 MobC family plasmid mobilization relaxosome protein [Nocardia otitidiscaviarum]
MAGESRNRRSQAARSRAANVAGGRPHRHVLKLSDTEHAELAAMAEAAGGISIQRLLVETTLERHGGEAGRAAAVRALLDLDTEVRRVGNNLNQLVRYAHQERELPENLDVALRAVTRACLSVDATARWVMGKAPAVSAVSVSEEDLAVEMPDLDAGGEWADLVDPDA